MTNFSDENWQEIKALAARLQAIKSILDIFNLQISNQPFARDLDPIKRQLESEFEAVLTRLLALIDEDY